MPLGPRGEVRELLAETEPAGRYVDLAIRLEVHEAGLDGPTPTGRDHVYGGVWDTWTQCYDLTRTPTVVVPRRVTQGQYDYCRSTMFRITGAGGRGGGKSEALAQRCECLLLERPGEHGLVVSPDYAHTQIVWRKILNRMHQWTLPGTQGIHRTEHLLRFITGSTVRFLSADNPDSLRGWDAHWMGVDEEKDVSDEAIDIGTFCLREAKQPLIFGAGTPEIGEYSERYDRLVESDKCEVFKFPSLDNCFIPHTVFELAKDLMDEKRYRQEVLAEFVRMDEDAIVAKGFDRELHSIDLSTTKLVNITKRYTHKKLKKAFNYILGVDYNHYTPCVAWVYQVYSPNIWVVIDIIKAPDPAHRLAWAIKEAGYKPSRCLVVDDASGEWQDAAGGSRSPNSSRRFMRDAGFTCINPDARLKRNPPVRARVDALCAKLAPAKGEPTWFYNSELGEAVWRVMENQTWAESGWTLDKKIGSDHDMDACTYPLHRLEPPMVFAKSRLATVKKW